MAYEAEAAEEATGDEQAPLLLAHRGEYAEVLAADDAHHDGELDEAAEHGLLAAVQELGVLDERVGQGLEEGGQESQKEAIVAPHVTAR